MDNMQILSKSEVLKIGYEFDERIEYAGEYGQQLCKVYGNKEIPISGIVYELYENGNIQYYRRYFEGISNGENVSFYENNNIKSYGIMYKAVLHGKTFVWYSNGRLKSETDYLYGITVSRKEWDDKGNMTKCDIIKLQDYEKKMIKECDRVEKSK
jgi:antitoxin component YwqK of YwqJK toxin-antitoxin module